MIPGGYHEKKRPKKKIKNGKNWKKCVREWMFFIYIHVSVN
jgi:hypothetical protein